MVIDKGFGPAATRDILVTSSAFIHHWKLSFGTPMVYPTDVLLNKLDLLRSQGIIVYPGGTLYEACALDRQTPELLDTIKDLGFSAVEISDGTIDISCAERQKAIAGVLDRRLIAITEVGKKSPYQRITPSEVAERALGLRGGCSPCGRGRSGVG